MAKASNPIIFRDVQKSHQRIVRQAGVVCPVCSHRSHIDSSPQRGAAPLVPPSRNVGLPRRRQDSPTRKSDPRPGAARSTGEITRLQPAR